MVAACFETCVAIVRVPQPTGRFYQVSRSVESNCRCRHREFYRSFVHVLRRLVEFVYSVVDIHRGIRSRPIPFCEWSLCRVHWDPTSWPHVRQTSACGVFGSTGCCCSRWVLVGNRFTSSGSRVPPPHVVYALYKTTSSRGHVRWNRSLSSTAPFRLYLGIDGLSSSSRYANRRFPAVHGSA